MRTETLSRVDRQILIRAPLSRVWRAITSIDEFAKWFGVTTEGEFVAGSRVRMRHPDYEADFFVDVVSLEPERRFVWRWQVAGFPNELGQEPATEVVFELEEVRDGTLVKVAESGFDQISLKRRAKSFEDNDKGWEAQLQSVRNYVEGRK
jgi:uncharacterized protein YndB with AHSA1/START domain